jgi:hypothetical protein
MQVSIIVDLPPTKTQVVVDRQMSIVIGHVVCVYEWLCREAGKVPYFSVIFIGNFKIEVLRVVENHIVYFAVFCVLQEHCYMNQINVNLNQASCARLLLPSAIRLGTLH